MRLHSFFGNDLLAHSQAFLLFSLSLLDRPFNLPLNLDLAVLDKIDFRAGIPLTEKHLLANDLNRKQSFAHSNFSFFVVDALEDRDLVEEGGFL